MPSPSLSALHGSVPIATSVVSGRRSLSSSVSTTSGRPSPSQSDAAAAGAAGVLGAVAAGVAGTSVAAADGAFACGVVDGDVPTAVLVAAAMTGDLPAGVYAGLSRRASTRSWKRVPLAALRNGASFAGTLTTRTVLVADSALTNTARAPVALNSTVLRFLPARKPLPRMVRRSPIFSLSGATEVTFGGVAAFAAAGTTASRAQTSRRSRATGSLMAASAIGRAP